jgi:hypothetical protein
VKRTGFKRVYKQLLELYDTGYILEDDTDTMTLTSLMHVLNRNNSKIISAEEFASILIAQYQVVDFESQFRIVNKTQKKALEEQLTDKTDPGALIEINERYFEDSPLKLMELNQYNKNREIEDE